MEDTSEHVKKLQLEIWLTKPPKERLRLTLQHNDELYAFWNGTKKKSSPDNPAKNTDGKQR